MAKNNRICKVCGESYSYCPTCGGASANEKYKIMFCSKNCKDIFDTCSAYNVGVINKETATTRLKELDLSKKSEFTGKLKENVDELTAKPRKQRQFQLESPISIEPETPIEEVVVTE